MLLCRVSYGWFIVCNEIENIYNKKRKGKYGFNSFLTPYGYVYDCIIKVVSTPVYQVY